MRPGLGVKWTTKTAARSPSHTRRAAVIFYGVPQHGNGKRMESDSAHRGLQHFCLFVVGKRTHWVRFLSVGCKWVQRCVSCNANFPFRFLIARFQIVVRDRPIFQRRSFNAAVRCSHPKIFIHESPRHSAVAYRARSDTCSNVVVCPLAGIHNFR